jgi:hypothetical protein
MVPGAIISWPLVVVLSWASTGDLIGYGSRVPSLGFLYSHIYSPHHSIGMGRLIQWICWH